MGRDFKGLREEMNRGPQEGLDGIKEYPTERFR